MLQSIDRKNKLFYYFILFIFLSTFNNLESYDNKEKFSEIKYIEVLGLSIEENEKIKNDLKFILSKNIFFIKKNYFNNIIDKNNLVETFYIKKLYPNLIRVYIQKTEFLALTVIDNKKFYIASNGRFVLAHSNQDQNLPYVFGKIKHSNFINFINTIKESKLSILDIKEFYFFPSNRWDIKTKDKVLIKLPKKNLIKALEVANSIVNNGQFKTQNIIDLRLSNYIITSNE